MKGRWQMALGHRPPTSISLGIAGILILGTGEAMLQEYPPDRQDVAPERFHLSGRRSRSCRSGWDRFRGGWRTLKMGKLRLLEMEEAAGLD